MNEERIAQMITIASHLSRAQGEVAHAAIAAHAAGFRRTHADLVRLENDFRRSVAELNTAVAAERSNP